MGAVAKLLDNRGAAAPAEHGDDRALVSRAQAGDEAAFEALYRRHVPRIMGLCWRLCGGDESVAQELVQDAFVRAWTKLGSFRGDAMFSTWLHRLTVNVALSDRRLRVRRLERERPLEQLPAETGTKALDGIDRDLERAIARLPERARTVLVLHDVEGYKHREIAALSGMAEGTSKAQLHRARRLLRQWLRHE